MSISGSDTPVTPAMNVLWIMTDQLQADCLGFMGNSVVQTPNLDRLARRGIVFDQAFCQSPVCMASRASAFTGRYPAAIRVRGMGLLPPSETTCPETLRRNGYATGCFGKLHLTPEQYTRDTLGSDVPIADATPFLKPAGVCPIADDPFKKNYGFGEHIGCDDRNQGHHRRWLAQHRPDLLTKEPVLPYPNHRTDVFVSPYPSQWHPSSFIADRAADFIEGHAEQESPWFTFCSFIHPHHPFDPPQDQIDRYAINDMVIPDQNGGPSCQDIPEPAASAIGNALDFPEDLKKRIVLHYYASISLIDDCVGMLIDRLKQTGQIDNTIIIFAADHGEFLLRRGLMTKPSMHYDELIRVPLMICLPGEDTSSRRVTGLVELTDLLPTLLGLLSIQAPPGVQGTDFSEAIHSGSPIGRSDIYSDMYDLLWGPCMAVTTLRTEQWKLNIYPTAEPHYGQLFDLKHDPYEHNNLYREPAYSHVKLDMLWKLAARQVRNVDPLPLLLTQY